MQQGQTSGFSFTSPGRVVSWEVGLAFGISREAESSINSPRPVAHLSEWEHSRVGFRPSEEPLPLTWHHSQQKRWYRGAGYKEQTDEPQTGSLPPQPHVTGTASHPWPYTEQTDCWRFNVPNEEMRKCWKLIWQKWAVVRTGEENMWRFKARLKVGLLLEWVQENYLKGQIALVVNSPESKSENPWAGRDQWRSERGSVDAKLSSSQTPWEQVGPSFILILGRRDRGASWKIWAFTRLDEI